MKDNVLNAIGDILIINVESKVTGRVHITDFVENIDGINNTTRNVKREYRISSDGIFYSDWQILSGVNLSASEYIVTNNLIIQLRYTRIGNDNTGTIEFKSINFTGTCEVIQFVAPVISSSIFSDIIGTNEIKELEDNIFKKLYFRGIVPKYITRGDNFDEKEDRDYIDLFFSISRFFSMFIRFFKRFEGFSNDLDLMREQVRQYGIYFDETNINLEELQYLAQNIYDQIRQRGTVMIFKRKGFVLPNGETLKIDGEFLRLFRIGESDEILYENITLEKVGWCLKNSSPMYRGTNNSKFLNKTKELSEDFENLSDFIINKSGDASFELFDSENKKVLKLKASNNGKVGLGRLNDTDDVSDNMYVVDSNMDYEITFCFQVLGSSSANPTTDIIFGVEGFNNLKNKISDAFITPNGFSISEIFFKTTTENKIPSVWYFVRGIIHAYSTANTPNVPTNAGFGNNLYFNNKFVKYILPKIQLTSINVSEIAIWNYKIRPLVRGTNILPLKSGKTNSQSLGFIQSSRLLYIYAKNNNNSQSESEITDIVERYLLPQNVTNIFVNI